MPELGTLGSVRGALSNERPYRDIDLAHASLSDHLSLAGALVFSQGLGGRGDTQAALTGVPLSQQGAFPTFSKLGLDATWTQPLPYDLVSGSMIFSCSMTEPGHPCVTISGNAFSCFERT